MWQGLSPCSRNEGEMNTNQTLPTGHTKSGRAGENTGLDIHLKNKTKPKNNFIPTEEIDIGNSVTTPVPTLPCQH